MVTWGEVTPEVITIAQSLIERYHPRLQDARIGFVFRSEAPVSQGRQVMAKAARVSDKMKAVMESQGARDIDFVIWIAFDVWQNLGSLRREALIDHELYHCVYDPVEHKASIRAHDFEEFHEVVERHGLWTSDLLRAGKTFHNALQLSFDHDVQPPRGSVVALQPALVTEDQ